MIFILALILIAISYGVFIAVENKRNNLGIVRRVKNINPKPHENGFYNIVSVDIDGIITELAFTDSQIISASVRMSKNQEDMLKK